MKRLLLIALVACSFAMTTAFAISLEPLLNKITLQLKAENWVTTTSALVDVNINAAVADQNIVALQNEILGKLKQLADGDWHIINFARSQDQSGLESIQILAEVRLPQANLGNLRDKAKGISKPGETFTIENIQFVPSEDELRQANTNLRNNIYQQIKAEIDAVNKAYPDQKFYMHSVDFMANMPRPVMRNMLMKGAGGEAVATAAAAAPLEVGNKVELNAFAVIAAMPALPQQLTTKLQ